MAVAFVVAASAPYVSGTTLTFAINVGSGANRGLVVGVGGWDASGDVSATGVTFAGNAMTLAGGQNENGGNVTQIWVRAIGSDASGSQNVVITFPGAITGGAAAGALAFTGVHQTTPSSGYVDQFGGPGTDVTVSVDVTSATDDMVVSCAFGGGVSVVDLIPGSGETEQFQLATHADALLAGATEPGAATVTMAFTVDAVTTFDELYLSAINIKASTSGAVSISPGVGAANWTGRVPSLVLFAPNTAHIIIRPS